MCGKCFLCPARQGMGKSSSLFPTLGPPRPPSCVLSCHSSPPSLIGPFLIKFQTKKSVFSYFSLVKSFVESRPFFPTRSGSCSAPPPVYEFLPRNPWFQDCGFEPNTAAPPIREDIFPSLRLKFEVLPAFLRTGPVVPESLLTRLPID